MRNGVALFPLGKNILVYYLCMNITLITLYQLYIYLYRLLIRDLTHVVEVLSILIERYTLYPDLFESVVITTLDICSKVHFHFIL